MDFDGLEKQAAVPTNKMIYLCNPHDPVGRVWTKAELQRLGDVCARHNVLVVSDEIHGRPLPCERHAVVPMQATEPVGIEKLKSLCAIHESAAAA